MGVTVQGVAGERLVTLDFIRGVAVLGILYANIVPYSQPMLAAAWPGALTIPMDTADRLVWAFQFLLVDARMRGLFTLLFGASMILFVDRKDATLQFRRLVWLALFGLAHYFLLFRGDILFTYAICGMVALALGAHKLEVRPLIVTGLVLYLVGALFSAILYLPDALSEHAALAQCEGAPGCVVSKEASAYGDIINEQLDASRRETAAIQGSFAEIVGYNASEHGWGPLGGLLISMFETLPLVLIGMGLLRAGLFRDSGGESRLLGWGLAGITLGMILNWPLMVWLIRQGDPLYLTYFVILGPAQIARLPMTMGLAAVLAWLAPRMADGWFGTRLIAAGRMAFSNYLGTSLLMAAIFQGWGLALFGRLDRVQLLIPLVLGCVVMLAWSKPWLDRYRQGPLEWVWRCLTYGRKLPFRR